jgi:hypothetical protein
VDSSRFEKVVEGVYALAVWDASWNSYNNCYAVLGARDAFLIDTGKGEHVDLLIHALSRLQRTPRDVTTILATHGHHDHVGGSVAFAKASKVIHVGDWRLLSGKLQGEFTPSLPDEGTVLDFDCLRLGQHTAGSVALFHRATKVLFSGDHLCFFGAPLSAGGLVGRGAERREEFCGFVSSWASHWPPAGAELERLTADLARRPSEDRERYNFGLFLDGLIRLQRFNATALCTGHGPVLVEDIPRFISQVITAGRRSDAPHE